MKSNWVLPTYGCYALALGTADFIRGGLMVFSGGAATETHFVGHLTQAHAGTLIGLGWIAFGLRQASAQLRPIYLAILLANLLGVLSYVLTAPAGSAIAVLLVCASQLFWSICFAALLMRQPDGTASELSRPQPPGRILAFSFSILVTLSGLVWIFAPLQFATAAAGSLAGSAAVFAGQARGAADVGLGLVAWLLGTRREPLLARSLCGGLLVSNLTLAIAGLLAQLSVLYTPARWVVDGLHVIWAAGFAWLWVSMRRQPRPVSAR